MELGLFPDFFGNFSTRGERYYFCVLKVRFTRGETATNEYQKTQNSEKLKFLVWVEGTFGAWGGVCETLFAILDGSHYQKSQK